MAPLLTPKQAAAHLGIAEDTLSALRRAGEIPYVHIGLGKLRDRPRYEVEDLDAWVKKRKRTAVVPSPPLGRRRKTFAAQNAETDYSRKGLESFRRALEEIGAKQDARTALQAAADEKRRLRSEGIAARKAERARIKAEKARDGQLRGRTPA